MQKKVGILGGTFDPIHMAHLILAEAAREQFDLDTVLLMPTGQPPHKTNQAVSDKIHRIKMVQLAVEDNKYLKASSFEIERSGMTYTSETLSALAKENSNCQYYFIIGADSLFHMEHWYHPNEIFRNAMILAAVRGETDDEDLIKKIEELDEKFCAKIHLMNTPHVDISSSMIRERIKEGHTIKYFVPKDVEKYIYQNSLYKD